MREVPTKNYQHSFWKPKTRGALPDNKKLHLLESIGQNYDQSSCRSGVLTAFRSQEFHFEQRSQRRHFRTTDIFGARIPFNDPVVSPSTKDGDLLHTHNLMIVEGSKGIDLSLVTRFRDKNEKCGARPARPFCSHFRFVQTLDNFVAQFIRQVHRGSRVQSINFESSIGFERHTRFLEGLTTHHGQVCLLLRKIFRILRFFGLLAPPLQLAILPFQVKTLPCFHRGSGKAHPTAGLWFSDRVVPSW